MSTEQQAVDRILSHPSSVQVHGDRPLAKRRLGDRFRHLVKTGVLSVVLLAQVAQIAHAGPLIEHMTQPQQEGPAAAQMVQAGSEVAPFSVELVNPIEKSGIPEIMQDNGISGTAAIAEWWGHGIEDLQVLQLTQLMIMGQSPTLVTSEQAKMDALEVAKRTEGIFSIQSQEEAVEFLSENGLRILEDEGLFIAGTEWMNSPASLTSNTVIDYWEAYSRVGHGEAPPLRASDHEETAEEFAAAVADLKQAVAEAGINSLRIPLPMWSSPAHLKDIASKLSEANADMQQLTGWDGQVLGLKGNLDLTIGAPYNLGFAGLNASGNVEVLADFDMLVHEVVGHGVDTLLAKQAGYTPGQEGGAPLFSRALIYQADTIPDSHVGLAKTWSNLKEGVSGVMNGWEARFSDHQEITSGRTKLEYFSTAWEKIAYSLEGVAMDKLGSESVLTYQGDTPRQLFPSQQEAQDVTPVWEQTFDTLNQSWWSKLPAASIEVEQLATAVPESAPAHLEVSFPSMSQWRQARATQATAPVPQVAVSSAPVLGR